MSLTQLTETIGFFALKTERLTQVPSQQFLTQLVVSVDNSLSITTKDCKELYILIIILNLLIMTCVKWKFLVSNTMFLIHFFSTGNGILFMKKNESKLTVLFVNAYQEFLTLPLKLFLGIRLQIPVKDVGSSIKAIEKRGVFSISITKRMLCFTSGQQKKTKYSHLPPKTYI